MLEEAGYGDLFAPQRTGRSSGAFTIWANMSETGGGFALLFRISAEDILAMVGGRSDGDLTKLVRHMAARVRWTAGGNPVVDVDLRRAKLGKPIAKPVSDALGDWLLGPIPIEFDAPGEPRRFVDDCARRGLMPLTWRDLAVNSVPGGFELPDLLSLPSEVGDGGAIVLPGNVMAVRRRAAASNKNAGRADEPSLPLAPPSKRRAPEAVIADAPSRKRNPVVRLSVGVDGRIGITVPPNDMATLWSGMDETAERKCHLVKAGDEIVLVPDGDPLAGNLDPVPVGLKLGDGPNWYGRSAVRPGPLSELIARKGVSLRAGREFSVRSAPGRLSMKGVLAVEESAVEFVSETDQDPVAAREMLQRAKRLMSEALGLVRAARVGAYGAAEIEFVDDRGAPLVAVPRAAAEARIRVEIA